MSVKLGDFLSFKNGGASPARGSGAYPVFGANGPIGYAEHWNAPSGSCVIGRVGSYCGSVHYLSHDSWVTENSIVATAQRGPDRFWYYALGQMDLRGMSGGSGQPLINQRVLAEAEPTLPEPLSWRAIAEVLGALDDKIAANERVVRTSQRVADALGRRLLATASGPSDHRLEDVAQVINGLSYRSADLVEGAPDHLVTLKSITRDGGYVERGLKAFSGAFKPEQEVAPGEIVVAQTDLTQAAEVVGRAVRLPKGGLGVGRAIASLDLAVVRSGPEWPSEALLAVMRDERFRQHCLARTSGTTVLHLKRGAIGSYELPNIGREERAAFTEQMRPLDAQRDSVAVQSATLGKLRDALLPELMSGRMRVKDAESTVEGVL